MSKKRRNRSGRRLLKAVYLIDGQDDHDQLSTPLFPIQAGVHFLNKPLAYGILEIPLPQSVIP